MTGKARRQPQDKNPGGPLRWPPVKLEADWRKGIVEGECADDANVHKEELCFFLSQAQWRVAKPKPLVSCRRTRALSELSLRPWELPRSPGMCRMPRGQLIPIPIRVQRGSNWEARPAVPERKPEPSPGAVTAREALWQCVVERAKSVRGRVCRRDRRFRRDRGPGPLAWAAPSAAVVARASLPGVSRRAIRRGGGLRDNQVGLAVARVRCLKSGFLSGVARYAARGDDHQRGKTLPAPRNRAVAQPISKLRPGAQGITSDRVRVPSKNEEGCHPQNARSQ